MKGRKLRASELPGKNELPEVNLLSATLRDYTDGRINFKQFMGDVLSWSYFYIFERGGFIPERLIMKPFLVSEYERTPKDQLANVSKAAKDGYNYAKNKWLDENKAIRTKNKSDYLWLEKMRSYYRFKKDMVKVTELTKRINMYEGVI
jgi:hypothetical protein